MTPLISFYLPPTLWPADFPTSPNDNWAGYGLGIYAWTIQTYLQLQAAGIACELTQQLPDAGIVFCHSNVLRSIASQNAAAALAPQRLFICIKAEAPLSEIAPLHIVQNPTEASPIANRYFIPHWPQPQLIPRDPARGDRFENLAFFGHADSLAQELTSTAWQTALAERGLRWRLIANQNPWNRYETLDNRWNDYHDIDAIVAVRSFNPWQRWFTCGFSHKPATKLINAWLSGAIAILGAESAYRHTGQRGRNYIEVTSFSVLLHTLDQLKASADFRRSLTAQGQIESDDYSPQNIVRKWQIFLEAIAIPTYTNWCRYSPRQRQKALLTAKFNSYRDKLTRRGQRALVGLT